MQFHTWFKNTHKEGTGPSRVLSSEHQGPQQKRTNLRKTEKRSCPKVAYAPYKNHVFT